MSDPVNTFTQYSRLHFPHIPDSFYHPPLSIEFLETYNAICQCETRLNTCVTHSDIQDVQADCYSIYHRIYDQPGLTLGLSDRVADLDINVKLKLTRFCNSVIRNAARLADDIELYRYVPSALVPAPSVDEVHSALLTTDDVAFSLITELASLKTLYIHKIRPILVSYWEDEPSSDCDSVSPDFHELLSGREPKPL
jgi:hypothetical protein